MTEGLRLNTNIAAREFFQTSLVTYLVLTLAETLKTGVVSNFFNMNYLLLVVLVTGLAMVLTESEETPMGQAVAAGKQKVAQVARAVTPAPVRRTINGLVVRGPQVIDLRQAQPVEKPAARPAGEQRSWRERRGR
jgi:hypothetical protein